VRKCHTHMLYLRLA